MTPPTTAEMQTFLDDAKALHARGVELNRPWTGVSHLVLAELANVVLRVSEAVEHVAGCATLLDKPRP